jgi:multiple sugar transport system permease protein
MWWPTFDDTVKILSDRFEEALGGGSTLGDALEAAQERTVCAAPPPASPAWPTTARRCRTPTMSAASGGSCCSPWSWCPLMVVLGTALALVLEAGTTRWPRFFRTAFFLPYGIPGVIASIMWGFLYAPGTSPFTPLLDAVGADVDLLGQETVFWSITNIVVWQFVGYNMLVVVAQLQAIPRVLYEAARIDGASRWRIARDVQLPLIRPALVLITVFTIIGSLQLFNEPHVLWPLSSGISSTYTPTRPPRAPVI